MSDATDRAIEKATAGIEQLAMAFKRVAPDVWHSLVTYHRVTAIAALVVWVLVALACAFVARWGWRNRNAESVGESDFAVCLFVGAALCGFAWSCVGLGAGTSWLGDAIAPEREAMRGILKVGQ
ncbi:MAG TPA: hypothetical protein VG734_25515 [Lacunisphaera sp.]|nr:hypothetical protein [Lacunisphaera sp.]